MTSPTAYRSVQQWSHRFHDQLTVLGLFLASRLIVIAGIWLPMFEAASDFDTGGGDPQYATRGIPPRLWLEVRRAVGDFDGAYYAGIIANGYPSNVPPNIDYLDPGASISFFPGFPLVVRLIDPIVPGSPTVAAGLVNLILGFVAALLVFQLGKRWYNRRVGVLAAGVFVFAPGAFVLSWNYAEAMFICCCALALIELDRERWVAAGLWSALATFTRPNGVAIVVACVVAFIVDWRTNRRLNALVAVVLAPVGAIIFMLYLAVHTGEPTVWFRSQREAWGESYSWGLSTLQAMWRAVTGPLDPNRLAGTLPGLLAIVAVTTVIIGFVAARRHPIPAPAMAFSIVIVFLMLITQIVIARPRFAFTAFPLMIPIAVVLERRAMTRLVWFALSAGALGLISAAVAGLVVVP